MVQNWYRLDEKENAIDFIESAATYYSRSHPHKWKWLTISLHGALYGFAILAVQSTDYTTVTNQRGHLISLGEALKWCQDDKVMLQYTGSQTLKISDVEQRAIKQLSGEFRNNFEHFIPKLWSIEASGFREIVAHVCRLIDFLAFSSGNIMLTPGQGQRVRTALESLGGKVT